VTRSARAAALRSTALATSLALAVGLSAFAAEAAAKPKVPLPKPRPIARNVVPTTAAKNTAPASAASQNTTPAATAAPATLALAPATRQPAALPPPPRKPSAPAAIAATSSTSQADTEALENVIELVRKRKPADATQAQAAISDPVAKKLAEWLILRSDDNGASVERYRAFLSANPSWPSQTFLRRRVEAALWDDRRDDATIWAWFEN
jgi:soluble lytic murein transglycosylase